MQRAVIVYTTWPSIVEAEKAGRAIGASPAEAVHLAVRELHSYTTPTVIVLPVEVADPDYQAWIVQETPA